MAASIALLVAQSETPPSPSAAPSEVAEVEGTVAGPPKEVQVLKSAIVESLARQGLRLVLTVVDTIPAGEITKVVPGAEHAVARFRLDLTSLPRAKLYLLDGERRRVYVRWLSLQRGLDPVAVELIRFVVESSVEAIRAGRDIGVSREEYDRSLQPDIRQPVGRQPVPEVKASPAHPTEEPRPHHLELGVGARYEGTLLARGTFQHGPGLAVVGRLPRLRLTVDVLTRLPVSIGSDAAGARIQGGALRATGGFAFRLSESWSLTPGGGAGIDLTQVRPSAARPDLAASSSFWATSPFVRLFAALERDFRRLSVAVTIGVDLDLLGERYLVANASGTQEIFSPARARPFAAVVVRLGP